MIGIPNHWAKNVKIKKYPDNNRVIPLVGVRSIHAHFIQFHLKTSHYKFRVK